MLRLENAAFRLLVRLVLPHFGMRTQTQTKSITFPLVQRRTTQPRLKPLVAGHIGTTGGQVVPKQSQNVTIDRANVSRDKFMRLRAIRPSQNLQARTGYSASCGVSFTRAPDGIDDS